jgi:hypothetical protein
MKFEPETLMAYVDGELDAQTRRAVEQAIRDDPAVAAEVEQHRALRAELTAASDLMLLEPVPQHLIDKARSAPTSDNVADLTQRLQDKRALAKERTRRSLQWAALAASLVLGVFVGRATRDTSSEGVFATHSGALVASGALEQALSARIGNHSADAAGIAIGLTFRVQGGAYCRTFTQSELAGYACREGDAWRVHALARSQPTPGDDGYRMAGAELPIAVVAAIETERVGEALEETDERSAQQRGWVE